MSEETKKTADKKLRDIVAASEANVNHLSTVLDDKDFHALVELRDELKDTWHKKQVFRTETEMRMSVLQDAKYPTKAAKYWQCVREQNVFLENLMSLSFDFRRNEAKIKYLENKIEKEESKEQDFETEYRLEKLKIDLDEKKYSRANMELVAKDRMREINMWSNLKKEFNDGSFDTKSVNTHQLESYHKIMQNKAQTLTSGSSQPEVFNVLGQLQTIEREMTERGMIKYDGSKREALPEKQEFGKQSNESETNEFLPESKISNPTGK